MVSTFFDNIWNKISVGSTQDPPLAAILTGNGISCSLEDCEASDKHMKMKFSENTYVLPVFAV